MAALDVTRTRPSSALGMRTHVDEALFGESMADRIRKGKVSSTTAVVSKELLTMAGGRTISGTAGRSLSAAATKSRGAAAAPVLVTASQLADIRNAAVIKTTDDLQREKAEAHHARDARSDIAHARKEKIRALESMRLAHVPKSALELEGEAEKERRREAAKRALEEEVDDAKQMKMMQNYAITVSIRDRQLAEKKERDLAEKLADRMRDVETELARLEQMKRVHEREQSARVTARTAARDVYTQVDERIKAKSEQMAKLRREADEMVARMKEADEAAKKKLEAQRELKVSQLAEVLKANEEALRIKAERKAAAIAEDNRIEAIQLEMAAKKAAEEEERELQRKLREEAMFKLRGQVEKEHDLRSAADELRAKRAFEAGQRVERIRELERARKQAETVEELKRARVEMMETKQARVAEEIELDKAEFERAIEVQKAWLEAESKQQARVAHANRDHVRALLQQKEEKELSARAALSVLRHEGAVIRAAEDEKAALLLRLREEKVKQLLDLGVDPRYTVQLGAYDPSFAVKMDYKLGPKATGSAKAAAPAPAKPRK